jgi:hypothetical protein
MSLALKALLLSIGGATLGAAIAYANSIVWPVTAIIVVVGLFWILAQRQNWNWMASLGLVFFLLSSSAGVWLGLPSGALLFSLVAALCAWDLQQFIQRTRDAHLHASTQRRHVQRLIVVASSGLLFSAIALLIQVQIALGGALALGLISILGLSRAISFMRRESV